MTLHDAGTRVVTGEIDSADTYRAAGAARARLVLANASDTVNSNIVLTLRELDESLTIVALAERRTSSRSRTSLVNIWPTGSAQASQERA